MADFTPIGVTATVEGLNKFNSNIDSMNRSIGSVETTADKTGKSFEGFGTKLGSVASVASGALVAGFAAAAAAATGLAVAVGGVAVVSTGFALEAQQGVKQLQAQFGLTADEAEKLGEVGKEVFANNFADSIGEASTAVGLIQQKLGDLGDAELQSATENAFRLRDAFGVDLTESIGAVSTLTEEFGLTQQEAFDFLSKGFQEGLNSSDDFLDSVTEYGILFGNADASAGQFFSLLETGMQNGENGTDRAADAFKEFQIRFIEGNDGLIEGLGTLGLDYGELVGQVESGESTITDVFGIVAEAVGQTDMSILSNQEAVAKLGTQFEDLGTNAVSGISLATTSLGDMEGATQKIDTLYETLPARFEQFKRGVLVAIQPIGDAILSIAESVFPVFETALASMSGIIESNVAPALEQFGQYLEDNLPAAIEYVSGLWSGTLQPALVAVGGFIQDTVIPALGQLVSFFQDNIPKAVESASGVWESVLQPALEAVGLYVTDVLIPVWSEISKFLINNLPKAIDTASNAFDNVILPILTTFGDVITNYIIPAIQAFADFIQANLPAIQATMSGVFTVATAVVNAFVDVMANNVIPPIQNAIEMLIQSVESIGITWDDVWPALGAAVKIVGSVIAAAVGAIIATFTGMLTAVSRTIENLVEGMQNFKDGIDTIFGGVIDVIGGAVEVIVSLLSGDFQGALDGLTRAWEGINEIISGVWQTMEATVQLSIGTILAFVGGFVEGFVGFFVSLAEQLTTITGTMVGDLFSLIADGDWLGAGQLVMESIKEGVEGSIDSILDAISNTVDRMIEAFTDFDWIGIGVGIIDGIEKGIKDTKDKVIDTLLEMADDALGGVLRTLGILSPSKVFRDEVGKPIVEGWALGIENNKGLVLDAILDLGKDIINTSANFAKSLETGALAGVQSSLASKIESRDLAISELTRILGISEDELLRGTAGKSALSDILANPEKYSANVAAAGRALAQRQGEIAKLRDEEFAMQEKLSKIEEQRDQLGFLEKQADLIDTIAKNGLDAAEVLGDMELGLGLDVGGLLDATILAGEAIVENANKELEIAEEILAIRQKEAALKSEQDRLKFLQDQQKLIENIKKEGFDQSSILGGFKVGMDADMGEFLMAMTRFTSAMITQTEDQLGIASPSQVFKRIGEQTMAGLTQGIVAMGQMPANAMSAATGMMTQRASAPNVMSSQSNTFNTTINSQMDAAQFQAMLNRSLANAIQ